MSRCAKNAGFIVTLVRTPPSLGVSSFSKPTIELALKLYECMFLYPIHTRIMGYDILVCEGFMTIQHPLLDAAYERKSPI